MASVWREKIISTLCSSLTFRGTTGFFYFVFIPAFITLSIHGHSTFLLHFVSLAVALTHSLSRADKWSWFKMWPTRRIIVRFVFTLVRLIAAASFTSLQAHCTRTSFTIWYHQARKWFFEWCTVSTRQENCQGCRYRWLAAFYQKFFCTAVSVAVDRRNAMERCVSRDWLVITASERPKD